MCVLSNNAFMKIQPYTILEIEKDKLYRVEKYDFVSNNYIMLDYVFLSYKDAKLYVDDLTSEFFNQ